MIAAMASTAALSLFPTRVATDGVVASAAKSAFFPRLALPRAASRRSLPAATVSPRCAVAGGAGVQGMEEEEEVGESARPSRRTWKSESNTCLLQRSRGLLIGRQQGHTKKAGSSMRDELKVAMREASLYGSIP